MTRLSTFDYVCCILRRRLAANSGNKAIALRRFAHGVELKILSVILTDCPQASVHSLGRDFGSLV